MNKIIAAFSLTFLSAFPVYAQLETLGPAPLPVMSGNREILIPSDAKFYEISFADKKVALESIHAILGHFSASKPQYADVGYYPDAEGNPCGKDAAPCLIVGSQNNHYVGIAVWKVILPDSSPLRGGVAEFDVTFVGRPQAQKNKIFVAVTDSYSPNANNLSLRSLPPERSMRTIADTSDAHGTYRETISIPLPQGAAELFLIVADAGSSARMGVSRITLKAPADK